MWVVMGKSASGDDYGVMARFEHEPTDDELKELVSAANVYDDGYDSADGPGPGSYGSYIHLTVQQV